MSIFMKGNALNLPTCEIRKMPQQASIPKKRNSDRHPTVLRAAVFVYLLETVTASSSLRAKICVAVPANVLPTSYLHTPILPIRPIRRDGERRPRQGRCGRSEDPQDPNHPHLAKREAARKMSVSYPILTPVMELIRYSLWGFDQSR